VMPLLILISIKEKYYVPRTILPITIYIYTVYIDSRDNFYHIHVIERVCDISVTT
jgi:hypothetical protein